MTQDNKEKQEFLTELLKNSDAMVCLDARQPDVDVPKAHKTNPMLNLVFSLKFRRPFEVLEDGIYGPLSFGGRPHKCVIPFTAVWAIYEPDSQKGQVWEASIPEDIDWGEQIHSVKSGAPSKSKKSPKPGSGTRDEPADKPKRDRSHLRVIK
ncbi:MAG: hypothetical protein GWM98_05375 [Nitrospinaceae bacterium]|nr:hypothetical protein [Nitrospinaceae bacterium]NIR53999.1 hypothetical protein [Nitrospinaceae bacterium]NIS84418.1 hypothetical protein [Nitrospinaceae bacterium]NIT81209.1 hypothetical protein [Nitrospinaceae bacterium]NIU43498.1 hypothetical protein [Nitrospinaceae bacterium]